MARFNKFSVLVALLLACVLAVMLSPGLAEEELDIDDYALPPGKFVDSGNGDDEEPYLPPEPQPGYYHFLAECAKKMKPECGKEIFTSMFLNETVTVTNDCCHNLVTMGEACHTGLVKLFLSIPEFKPRASEALLKSEHTWKICVSLVGPVSTIPPKSSS